MVAGLIVREGHADRVVVAERRLELGQSGAMPLRILDELIDYAPPRMK
jgi:hypothetical protein